MSPVVTTSLPTNHQHPYDNDGNNNNDGNNDGMMKSNNASFSMLFSPAASSLASTPGGPLNQQHHHSSSGGGQQPAAGTVELDVDWDPATVQSELLLATSVLSHRGLKLAAKWAAEQLVGVHNNSNKSNNTGSNMMMQQQQQQQQYAAWSDLTHKDWYAKSLLDLGEYLHAAHVLSDTTNAASEGVGGTTDIILQIPGPASDLSSFGIYLRAYALYMAGERRKEEDHLELHR
jgi:hypothetical protein